MSRTPLAVLDLAPISSGATPGKALRNSIDLARACEYFGYARYWFADHHAMLVALTAAATSRIRIGSGAVQMGHHIALSTVEEFGLIDASHRGRLDLRLGRCPAQVADVLALLHRTCRSAGGVAGHPAPGESEGEDAQAWILGSSSGGESAHVAGANGLRFAANYHESPATILAAADRYRAAFRPSAELDRPYVSVSADVVVAPSEAEARELAEARAHVWSDADWELVAGRVETRFVGNPAQVAGELERLRDATGADELVITTITRDHVSRVRSYQLLAAEWRRR